MFKRLLSLLVIGLSLNMIEVGLACANSNEEKPTFHPIKLRASALDFGLRESNLVGYISVADDTDTPNPRSLIEASARACLEIKTIEYEFQQATAKNNGAGPNLAGLHAVVKQERADVPRAGLPGKYIATGTITLPEGAPSQISELSGLAAGEKSGKFAISYDGTNFQIIDIPSRSLLIGKSLEPAAMIRLRDNAGIATLGAAEFTEPRPFKRLLDRNPDFTYLGTAEVAGVKCHVIASKVTITNSLSGRPVTISSKHYVAVDDLLPRRTVVGTIEHTYKILQINKPFPEDSYRLKPPTGFYSRVITEADTKIRTTGLLTPGTPAPNWTLKDVKGTPHSLNQYRGKVVVLDFWATWCGPCIASMPKLQKIHETYGAKDVVVLGISNREQPGADPAGLMKEKGVSYGLLLNGESIVAEYHAQLLPTLYIIGKDGTVIHSERGYQRLGADEIEKVLNQYLKDGTYPRVLTR